MVKIVMQWRSSAQLLHVALFLVSLYSLLFSTVQLGYSNNISHDNSSIPSIISIPTNSTAPGFEYPPHVFGLVHMAKTAGSYINSYLASNYERVCGNKGNSFDIASRYRLVRETAESLIQQNKTPCYNLKCKFGKDKESFHTGDVIFKAGFEDCDYIAMEVGAKYWGEMAQTLSESPLSVVQHTGKENLTYPPVQMELHVPCRDPIDHLLSQCNQVHRSFVCSSDAKEWKRMVNRCMVYPGRFNSNVWADDPLLRVKCFSDSQVQSYVKYMSTILQPRRRKVVDFVYLASNKPRNKTNECLLSDEGLAREVRDYMLEKYHYYRWCQECLSGPGNLLERTQE